MSETDDAADIIAEFEGIEYAKRGDDYRFEHLAEALADEILRLRAVVKSQALAACDALTAEAQAMGLYDTDSPQLTS